MAYRNWGEAGGHTRYNIQFSHLAQQELPGDSNGPFQAYLHATESTHCYMLDLLQYTDDSLRFRTCIFPEEAPH